MLLQRGLVVFSAQFPKGFTSRRFVLTPETFTFHIPEGGSQPVINGVITPKSEVVTPFTYVFYAIYKGYIYD